MRYMQPPSAGCAQESSSKALLCASLSGLPHGHMHASAAARLLLLLSHSGFPGLLTPHACWAASRGPLQTGLRPNVASAACNAGIHTEAGNATRISAAQCAQHTRHAPNEGAVYERSMYLGARRWTAGQPWRRPPCTHAAPCFPSAGACSLSAVGAAGPLGAHSGSHRRPAHGCAACTSLSALWDSVAACPTESRWAACACASHTGLR